MRRDHQQTEHLFKFLCAQSDCALLFLAAVFFLSKEKSSVLLNCFLSCPLPFPAFTRDWSVQRISRVERARAQTSKVAVWLLRTERTESWKKYIQEIIIYLLSILHIIGFCWYSHFISRCSNEIKCLFGHACVFVSRCRFSVCVI